MRMRRTRAGIAAWSVSEKTADITPTDVDHLLTKIAAGRARPSTKKPTQKRRKKLAPPKSDQPNVVTYDFFSLHQLICYDRRQGGFNIATA
jgi:hypothetical protein